MKQKRKSTYHQKHGVARRHATAAGNISIGGEGRHIVQRHVPPFCRRRIFFAASAHNIVSKK